MKIIRHTVLAGEILLRNNANYLVANWKAIYCIYWSKKFHPRLQFILPFIKIYHNHYFHLTNPSLDVQSTSSAGTLTSQLDQTNDLTSLRATGREVALAIKSADKLAVVLGVGGGLDGGNDLLDGLSVLDSSQSTVTLAGLTAVALIMGHDAGLELIFLDIEVVLYNWVSFRFSLQ